MRVADILNLESGCPYETKWKDKNVPDQIAYATQRTLLFLIQQSVSYTLPRTPLSEQKKIYKNGFLDNYSTNGFMRT